MEMPVPHPIPYQGSKRRLAPVILRGFPESAPRLIEPFAGSAAVTLAAAARGNAERFVIADINRPLMDLWRLIVEDPDRASHQYERLWREQIGREREYYDGVRDEFNRTQKPECLLYLLARCVKAAVRYNSNGEFNQSPDNRRQGMNPKVMREQIRGASRLLRGKTEIVAADYRVVLERAAPSDVVYMDPPYQGVCQDRDARYIRGLGFEEFVGTLRDLNRRQISYVLSYDGRNDKTYGRPLPRDLELFRVEVNAGRSSQATLLGRNVITYESLYLSPALALRTGKLDPRQLTHKPRQITLFDDPGVIEWSGPSFHNGSSIN